MYRIALVEDHVLVRAGIARLINSFPGFQVVVEATDGKQLIDRLLPGALPDLVVMDAIMPNMDGYTATKWLKHAYPDLPVLTLTATDDENSVLKMLKNGASGYILKDSRVEELEMAMSCILKQGFYFNRHVSTNLINSINRGTQTSDADKLLKLTKKERDVLLLLCSERSYQEIAAELFISPRTIENYRDSLSLKLGVKGRVGLLLFAFRSKFIKY